MKLFLLSAFGICVAMSVAAPPPAPPLKDALDKLQAIAAEREKVFREFGVLTGEGEAEAAALEAATQPRGGLSISTLQGASLQGASLQPSSSLKRNNGVQSSSRGLTPEDEWRRMFPHKPGYSR